MDNTTHNLTQENKPEDFRDLADSYGYSIPLDDFFSCALSVDCVIFGYEDNDLKVLLIKRGAQPFKKSWALPGDLMYPDENLKNAAQRVLKDLTGLDNLFMEQASSFGSVDRHPVGRVVTVSYYALVNIRDYNPVAASWAKKLKWHSLQEIPELAFDHREILDSGMTTLRRNLSTRLIGFNLLPDKFTLKDIQHLYEIVLDKKFDKANFRKKFLSSEFLEPLEEMESNVPYRPAKLYKLADKVDNRSSFEI